MTTIIPSSPIKIKSKNDNIINEPKNINSKKVKKKKKSKKFSFKKFLKNAMKSKKTDEEKRIDYQNSIRKNMGGGTFSKIDKI